MTLLDREPIPRSFYDRPTPLVARALLGCVLIHRDDGVLRAGVIVETEAYVGEHDLACHARKGRTPRTEVLFGPPGHAYVYLIYGMHECFNVVTEREGHASAVLVRALSPLEGCLRSTDGPGKLTRALGITRAHNRADLTRSPLWLVPGDPVAPRRVARGARVGVDYAGGWAAKPLRFWVSGDPHVSAGARRARRSVP